MNRDVALIAILTAVLTSDFARAETIAEDTFDNSVGRISFTQVPEPGTFTSLGDAFQVFSAEDSDNWPPQLVDRSAVEGQTDTLGIIDVTSKTDAWFGITDTVNGDNFTGEAEAIWVFDISGATNLSAHIDIGAMGAFEETDVFNWTYSIDEADPEPLFTSSVYVDGSYEYTLADGETTRLLDDPLLINYEEGSENYEDFLVTNSLETFSAPISGAGAQLTITLNVRADGGAEGVAFDNLVISGTGENGGGGDDLPGDFDENQFVDAADFTVWRDNLGADTLLPNDNQLGTPIRVAHYNLWKSHFQGSPGSGGDDLPGDFDENQIVDAADFTVWRDNLGAIASLPNDDGLGIPIGSAHYELWKSEFGMSLDDGGDGLLGDFDGNNLVDAADFTLWRDGLGADTPLPNDDGLGIPIGLAHYELWKSEFGMSLDDGGDGLLGDFDGNNSVDAADFTLWRDSLGADTPLPNDNGLGTPIGLAHYELWKSEFGMAAAGLLGPSSQPVPAPTSASLLLIAIATISGAIRRRVILAVG